MSTKTKIFLLIVSVAFLAACSQKGAQEKGGAGKAANPSDVLAVVNGTEITAEEFNQEAASLPAGAIEALQSSDANKEKFLENLIDKELVVQKARAEKLDKDPEIQKRLRALEKTLMLGLFVKREVLDKASVTDKDVEDYFKAHKADLGPVRISHILVGSPADAHAVLDKLKAGQDFSKLAKQYSLDIKTKDKGGDLGYGKAGLKDAVSKLKVGDVSDIIQSQFGYHILKVTDRKPAADADLKTIKDNLKASLTDKKKEELFNSIVKSMKDSAKITKKPENLKAVKVENPMTMQGMPAQGGN